MILSNQEIDSDRACPFSSITRKNKTIYLSLLKKRYTLISLMKIPYKKQKTLWIIRRYFVMLTNKNLIDVDKIRQSITTPFFKPIFIINIDLFVSIFAKPKPTN